MRQVRTAALSRHNAPSFVMVAGLELVKLRQLGHLARSLFLEILALDMDGDGRIRTSYASLCALLDFDQAPGAHADDKPTLKRIRTALDHLVQAHLVRRDPIKNEKAGGLFLHVQTRRGISAPDAGKGRGRGRVESANRPTPATTSATERAEERQGDGQGIQDPILSPISPTIHSPARPTPEQREHLDRVRAAAARGGVKSRAPKGAGTSRAPARTPPGAAPPSSAQADASPPINRPTKGAPTMRTFGEAIGGGG